MSLDEVKFIFDDDEVYEAELQEEEIEVEVEIGVVTDCVKLNVRAEPTANATVVCTLNCLTEVMVEDEVDEFYKIYLPSGISGYCMKKYISIRP